MIPTVILLDLALGRWWRLAPVTAAIGWPCILPPSPRNRHALSSWRTPGFAADGVRRGLSQLPPERRRQTVLSKPNPRRSAASA
jgi:hypothetical protein